MAGPSAARTVVPRRRPLWSIRRPAYDKARPRSQTQQRNLHLVHSGLTSSTIERHGDGDDVNERTLAQHGDRQPRAYRGAEHEALDVLHALHRLATRGDQHVAHE